jgi:SAM-dependent methyltransferase
MYSDVADLRDYYQSLGGRTAQGLIRERIRSLWPNARGMRILGLGYATPYLRMYEQEAERTLALMPAAQGAESWPHEGAGRVFLADEADIPLPDLSIDRVILVHALESSQAIRPMLREIWRILASGGRLMVIAPNRRSLWAMTERTPFGLGSPFSSRQLRRLLKANMFMPEREDGALFLPPTESRFWLASAPGVEDIGRRWCKALAGVHVLEASKQIFASGAYIKQRSHGRSLAPAALSSTPLRGRTALSREPDRP